MRRARAAAALHAALALAGCAGSGDSSVEGPVTVYVSLPLSGPRAVDGRDAADGARLALERADGRAGDLEVRAVYLDDADGSDWDPAAVGRNARTAAEDSSTAAYIGELDSQPTRASVPVTNEAGIAQISPGAGAVDLTRPAEGYPESPEQFRPSASRPSPASSPPRTWSCAPPPSAPSAPVPSASRPTSQRLRSAASPPSGSRRPPPRSGYRR